MPEHRGKLRILRFLHALGLRSGRRFIWSMSNGLKLVLDPREGELASQTVGWTCFLERRWEPHVEAFLRDRLVTGDIAIDIGANIGYFTGVMAQAVGPTGRVLSFEPVAGIRDALSKAVSKNGLSQVQVHSGALGAQRGRAVIHVDPRMAGSSSIFNSPSASAEAIEIEVDTLDDRLAPGITPRLLKIDAEGAERDVLLGATRVLRENRPIIIFELNADASSAAGWSASDIAELLEAAGPYEFVKLTAQGPRPVDLPELALGRHEFIDLAALPV